MTRDGDDNIIWGIIIVRDIRSGLDIQFRKCRILAGRWMTLVTNQQRLGLGFVSVNNLPQTQNNSQKLFWKLVKIENFKIKWVRLRIQLFCFDFLKERMNIISNNNNQVLLHLVLFLLLQIGRLSFLNNWVLYQLKRNYSLHNANEL